VRFPSERLIRAFDGMPLAGLETLATELKAAENAYVRFVAAKDEYVLLVLKQQPYVCGHKEGDAYKAIGLIELFARVRAAEHLQYEAHCIDLPSVLVISVLMQLEPTLRAPLAMADVSVVLSDLGSRQADAAVVVCTEAERSFAFVRKGAVASVHVVDGTKTSPEDPPADRFLAYVYSLARESGARLEVYERLVVQRDDNAGLSLDQYLSGKAGPPPLTLTARRGGRTVQKRIVRGGLARIGRALDSDIVLDHPSVSREHARLRFSGSGYAVEDGGSANGTWLEGARIEKAAINFGQRFTVGEFEVLVESEGTANAHDDVSTLFVDNPVDASSARLLLDGHVHKIDLPVFTIGKGSEANVKLQKGFFIAPVQATIVREGPGRYRLSATPKGRTVRVNGKKVVLSGVMLSSGDMLMIGSNKLVFAFVSDRK
jgi:hypothetical protein